MKKVFTVIGIFACLFLYSCGEDAETKKKPQTEKQEEIATEEKTESPEEIEIPKVDVIYAKTPLEATEKCLTAFKSGNLLDATAYVTPDGKAFSELGRLKSKMIASFGTSGSDEVLAMAEKLANSALAQFSYTLKEAKTEGDNATLIYSVSMPDMGKINYSKYSDAYMKHMGMTQEQMMTELEGMSESEMQDWSAKYSLGLMNYVFESGEPLEQKIGTTTVKVEKHESGWLVSDIKNE